MNIETDSFKEPPKPFDTWQFLNKTCRRRAPENSRGNSLT